MRDQLPCRSWSLVASILLLALASARVEAQSRYHRPPQYQEPLSVGRAVDGAHYYDASSGEYDDALDYRAARAQHYASYYDDDPAAPSGPGAAETPMSRPEPEAPHDDGYGWVTDDGLGAGACAGCGSDSCAGDCYGGDCCATAGCDACGCDDLCGGCSRTATTCCTNYGLAAGVEATYLRPSYEGEGGIGVPADFGYEAAPRIWLAGQNSVGWGIRGRYWNFDAEQQFSGAGQFDDDVFGAQSLNENLELYAIDLELTRAFQLGQTGCVASLGARQGRIRHNSEFQFTLFDVGGGGGDDATVIFQQFDRDMEGTGLTFALGMRRPILQSRLAAVCNLRGSVLWGPSQLDITGAVIEVVPVGAGDLDVNDFQEFDATGSQNSHMWIGELQAGLEWSVPISQSYGGGQAFLQVLFEAQWWNFPGATATGLFDATTDDQIYDFLGVTAAAGFAR